MSDQSETQETQLSIDDVNTIVMMANNAIRVQFEGAGWTEIDPPVVSSGQARAVINAMNEFLRKKMQQGE